MSIFLISLLVAVSGATWSYTKIQRMTGGNTKTSIMMAVAAGVILFLFCYILGGFLPE